jgi:pimeloyl-ACP methyl ester carboxylesterase
VRSKIPTLVFAGSLDPITPPDDSKRVAGELRNAVYVELAGLGHGVTRVSDCARAIRQEFLTDPDDEPDLSCADEPAPPFLSQGLI